MKKPERGGVIAAVATDAADCQGILAKRLPDAPHRLNCGYFGVGTVVTIGGISVIGKWLPHFPGISSGTGRGRAVKEIAPASR